jgi:hypothetical protein
MNIRFPNWCLTLMPVTWLVAVFWTETVQFVIVCEIIASA